MPVERLYESFCSRCHGMPARDGLPMVVGVKEARNFADLSWQQMIEDAEIKRAILEGKAVPEKNAVMPAWKGILSDADVDRLVDYIRTFTDDTDSEK